MLIAAPWPVHAGLGDAAAMAEMEWVVGLISAIRTARAEMNVPGGGGACGTRHRERVPKAAPGSRSTRSRSRAWRGSPRSRDGDAAQRRALHERKAALQIVVEGATVLLDLAGAVDLDKERARLAREARALAAELDKIAQKLANPQFIAKAKAEIDRGTARARGRGRSRACPRRGRARPHRRGVSVAIGRLGKDPVSKAFTKETDGETEAAPRRAPALPAGVKNYMTPEGFRAHAGRTGAAFARVERPQGGRDRGVGGGQRRPLGERRLYLRQAPPARDRPPHPLPSKRLEAATVVDPAQQRNRDQVFFGATVTFRTTGGIERTVTIVGIDEADLERGQVSWISPIARALHKAREGDCVELKSPAGADLIEVMAIDYR